MTGKYAPFHTADTNIFLADNLGGFSVRHCPDPEELAALIVRAVNAHEALVKALRDIARQMLSIELRADDYPDPDYEGGFDECVKIARAALARGETA